MLGASCHWCAACSASTKARTNAVVTKSGAWARFGLNAAWNEARYVLLTPRWRVYTIGGSSSTMNRWQVFRARLYPDVIRSHRLSVRQSTRDVRTGSVGGGDDCCSLDEPKILSQ